MDGESARLLREKNRRRLGNLMDLDIQLSHTRVFPFKSGNGMRAKRFYLVSWLSTQNDLSVIFCVKLFNAFLDVDLSNFFFFFLPRILNFEKLCRSRGIQVWIFFKRLNVYLEF